MGVSAVSAAQSQDSPPGDRANQSVQSVKDERQLHRDDDPNHHVASSRVPKLLVPESDATRKIESMPQDTRPLNANQPKQAANNMAAISDCKPIDRCESAE
ncbi:MAG: hypothetical protein JO002_14500 [Burkholderiaceae bacterium]|nr:hypothetical protein [Burkholderiaceae bacterium]